MIPSASGFINIETESSPILNTTESGIGEGKSKLLVVPDSSKWYTLTVSIEETGLTKIISLEVHPSASKLSAIVPGWEDVEFKLITFELKLCAFKNTPES